MCTHNLKLNNRSCFNYNLGTYFISDVIPKGPNDLFNPNQILETVLLFFKTRSSITNGSESSSSKGPETVNTEHTQVSSHDTISRDHLNDIIDILFGKGKYRYVEKHEIESW